jgi:hypothetical protein
MKRILVLEYSQSGDVTKVADAFTRPLDRPGVEVRRVGLRPVEPFPYPWGSLRRLFGVFPECHVGPRNGIEPPALRPDDRFDLVVLAYQVWHLTPSLPVQAFLRSGHARVLRDAPVITLCVCRNMWHSASEMMKRLLREAGAAHLDNVVVTHQGPPFSTFISVPRALLYGKRDRLWGIFPPAEISGQELERVGRLGAVVASRLDDLGPPHRPLLTGLGAVAVRRRSIVPELTAWYVYSASAPLVARLGLPGRPLRELALGLFIGAQLVMIFLVLPLGLAVLFLLAPLVRGRIDRYARRLAEPSG